MKVTYQIINKNGQSIQDNIKSDLEVTLTLRPIMIDDPKIKLLVITKNESGVPQETVTNKQWITRHGF